MGKIGVWNHLKNVGLPTEEKKKKKQVESSGNTSVSLSATTVQTTSQNLLRYLQPTKDSVHKAQYLQNSKQVVATFIKFRDCAQTWLGLFHRVLHVGPSFCDWHGQEHILQMGSGKVSAPFLFYFWLAWVQGSAKTVCWKQQVVLCHHFSSCAFGWCPWWRGHFNIRIQCQSPWHFSL